MTNIARFFVVQTSDDGTAYTTHTDDAPEWLTDAIYEAHDGELPNDWRYEHCRWIAQRIDEGETETYDIADALTDTYTHDLMAWVSDYTRWAYCDVHLEDGSVDASKGMEHIVRTAQFYVLVNMADTLIVAADDHADDDDEDDA